ncbi:MAG TPA: chemotaxis-specific protein-glutamate methyltransferase CheB [Dongiaceae bacterium]|nr:chemotaxis-specific protein-glutamate methyltransferase CheB [Dongiaceae bacterium]
MKRIRVLVVEDSLTVRAHLVEILAVDPEIEVVGQAGDGKQAIELCMALRPDIITMDMMLPVMTGLAATEFIMAHGPTPILVVSASTNRGELFRTYDALAAGAVDVLEKPTGYEPPGQWEERFLATVKLVSRIKVITHPRARLPRTAVPTRLAAPVVKPQTTTGIRLVAIGASTGGPGAIVEILRHLPLSFRIPIALVMHIGEPFGAALTDWLDGQTERRVFQPCDGEPLSSAVGRVAMAPVGSHLVVRRGRFCLTRDPERHSCRPSVDVLFESVAEDLGAAAAAVLLTGMGKDGALGLLQIRQAGGVTVAQDQATSVIFGMPREAIEIGAADHILGVGDIAAFLTSLPKTTPEARP